MTNYKVTGPRDVFGHAPGSQFSADIPEAQERRLIKRGAITKVAKRRRKESQQWPRRS